MTKSQTVIPKPVRDKSGVGPGASVEFEIRDGEVLIRCAPGTERVDAFAVFHEWSSEGGGYRRVLAALGLLRPGLGHRSD